METWIGLIVIIAVFLLVQRLRFRSLVAAGRALGFTVTAGPTLDQRNAWTELARHVHSHVPTSWGASAEGRVQGQPVRMQEQEIRRTINGNREWHTLVVLDLADTTLPEFTLQRSGGTPLLRQVMAPMVDPLVRALGGDPTPAAPGAGVASIAADAAFCARWQVSGADTQGLERFFDAATRAKILALELDGELGGGGSTLAWFAPCALKPSQLPQLIDGAQRLRGAFGGDAETPGLQT